MERRQAMSLRAAIGVGCKSNVGAETIARVVREAIARAHFGSTAVGLHTSARKIGDAELREAAQRLELDLIFHNDEALKARGADIVSRSGRVMEIVGVGSVAEAAALVGAGEGSRLVVPKFSADGVSCAVAVAPEETT
jgi:cobalt-precorrin 5A hydrolase